jgi:hypothetical protein
MSTRSLRLAVLALAALTSVAVGAAPRADAQGAKPRRGGLLNTVLIEDPPGLIIESATVSTCHPATRTSCSSIPSRLTRASTP